MNFMPDPSVRRDLKSLATVLFIWFAVLTGGTFIFTSLIGCANTTSKVVQVQTLKAAGEAAEAAVDVAGGLYQSNVITEAQLKQVRDQFNLRFMPAYRIAAAGILYGVEGAAPPDVLSALTDLQTLVNSFHK